MKKTGSPGSSASSTNAGNNCPCRCAYGFHRSTSASTTTTLGSTTTLTTAVTTTSTSTTTSTTVPPIGSVTLSVRCRRIVVDCRLTAPRSLQGGYCDAVGLGGTPPVQVTKHPRGRFGLGDHVRLVLKLKRSGKRILRTDGRLEISVQATIGDRSGPRATFIEAVTLSR